MVEGGIRRTPCDSISGDEQETAGDNTLAGRTRDSPADIVVAVDAVNVVAVAREETSSGEEPTSHEKRAEHESRATSPLNRNEVGDVHSEFERDGTYLVDPEDGGNGHGEVDDVLDGRGGQVSVACQAGHLEDVDDVVHHDVDTLQLTIHRKHNVKTKQKKDMKNPTNLQT